MRTFPYLSCVATALLGLCSLQAHASVEILPLPEGVTKVSPVQGRVSLDPNENPLGVCDLAVTFPQDVKVNINCAGEASVYVDGSDTPYVSVNYEAASFDFMIPNVGSLYFGKALNFPATYHVSIPEGLWLVGESETPSPAIELNYEIIYPQSVSPAPGSVESLAEIRLDFPGYDEVSFSGQAPWFYGVGDATDYEVSVRVGTTATGKPSNYAIMTISPEPKKLGDYKLKVDARAFELKKFGPDYASNPEDVEIEYSVADIYEWSLTDGTLPEVSPADGSSLEAFTEFEITPSGFESFFADTMGFSYIYPVNEDDTLSGDALCKLKAVWAWGSTSMTLKIQGASAGQYLESLTPAPGRYCLVVSPGMWSGTNLDGEFVNSPEYRFYYTIEPAYGLDEPLPLPEGIRSVSPAQGRLDISPNVNPLGAQEIAVTFADEVKANPNCAELACVYVNGEEAPYDAVDTSAASYDAMMPFVGSLKFNKRLNFVAKYHIVVPAGFWLVGAEETPSPAFALNYEVFYPQEVSPAPGTVDDLSEIIISFPGYDEIAFNENVIAPDFYQITGSSEYSVSVRVGTTATGKPSNYAVLTVTPAPADGDYKLALAAKSFLLTKYGENYASDPTDVVTEYSVADVYSWSVSSNDAPAIDPADGSVLTEFTQFKVSPAGEFSFWFPDTMGASYIYAVGEDGALANDPLCVLKSSFGDGTYFTLSIQGESANEFIPSLTPAPGEYCLVLSAGAFSGSLTSGEFVNSPEYRYYYTIKSDDPGAVAGLEGEESLVDVYTLSGIRVGKKLDRESLRQLPQGLYIINGKKVILK